MRKRREERAAGPAWKGGLEMGHKSGGHEEDPQFVVRGLRKKII